ncbi:DNA-binding MarR family transcriptional regulator [Caulobacter ginsengisoli]|uniref:DNA-binding MarR family transcriptional regulator n=1 Tax=Caulobacter ginsengisoli TaxID=400775 RepID=A0ABU0IZH3_9CAUL|nr:MarR family transcriptional regulator [Caulobacter ginsengisoli]MDQ0466696.1 DNA-binding MarR family transcriptional regulator [Caulobacter ginsengisoli]
MSPRPPPRTRPDVELFTEIGIIQQLSNAALERALPDGLSAAGFGVLTHFVRRGGEESPARLAGAFQVTKGAMTNTLQRLEAAGFVAIRGDAADGRRKLVSLTPAGRAAYEDGLVRLRPRMEGLRTAFSDADFETALPFLRALRIWLDEHR